MNNLKHTFSTILGIAIVIVIIGTWITIDEIYKQEKKDLKGYLESILESTHQGIGTWAEGHKQTAIIWAKEVLPITKELLKINPSPEELINSPLQMQIRKQLNPVYRENDYEGFFIISPDNINLASSRNNNLGITSLLTKQKGLLERVWNGETVLTIPMRTDIPLPTTSGRLDNTRATMFICTPVKNNMGEVIAIFALRINPGTYFTKIFERGRLGKSGETYGIDLEGRMISNTRFNKQLVDIGMISSNEYGILKIKITDPGVNLVKGEKSIVPSDSLPLTLAANSLTNRKSGINLDGYRDYRGVPVIGMWSWNDQFDFGTVTEIDLDEAYSGYYIIKSAIIALTILIIGLIIALGIIFNFTKKKLVESNNLYKNLYTNSPIGIYQTKPDGTILKANPTLIRMLEFDSFDDLKERNLNLEGYSNNSSISRKDFAQRIKQEGFVKGLEEEWMTKSGKTISIRENARLVTDQEGRILYYEGTVEDITEKKRIEEDIRLLNAQLETKVKERTTELEKLNDDLQNEIIERKKIEERIRLVFESSPYSIILVNSDGTIRLANATTKEYFGYEIDQLIGANIDILVPKKDGFNHPNFIRHFFNNPDKRSMGAGRDLYAIKKDGSVFPVEIGLNPIEIDGESLVLANIINITERKQNEDLAKRAKLEAEEANRAKSEFLSRMSHELRTPLNSILGYAQLMNMGELSASLEKGVKQILKSGKHLLRLINEVLDISRIEAGKITLSLEPIRTCKVIKEIVDSVNPLALEKNISIEMIAAEDYYVTADYQKLKQILLNLINNAIKYNRPKGIVSISCHKSDSSEKGPSKIRINVTDSGSGISLENIEKLFRPFERIGANATETEGTGLGLAIAKKLTDAMNGTIGVESEHGRGSTFWIELPSAKNPVKHAKETTTPADTIATNKYSGTLLYIEDNSSNIELVEQIITEHMPNVKVLANMFGKNAVQLAKDYKPFLILLDLDLPDIHGYQVLKQILADNETKHIPVVILSADAMEKQIEKLMKAGARRYLTKPLEVVSFIKTIDEFIN